MHDPARDYLERKQAEGKTRLEALRCLKRELVRRVWHLVQDPVAPDPHNHVDFRYPSGIDLT